MTIARGHKGSAKPTTLSGGISNTATSFVVASGGGTGYPDGSDGAFIVTVDAGVAAEEKILCSARTGDTFTVAGSGRGYDDTAASAHVNNASVRHSFSAIEASEANAHIMATSAAHAATAISNTPAGNIAATTVQAALNELDTEKISTTAAAAAYLPFGGGTLTGELVLPDLKVSGLTGSTSASRYVGATASGAPASGAHLLGDWAIDLTGKIFICTTAGTPGTWTQVGAASSATANPATLGLFAPGPGLAPNPSAAFSSIPSYAIYSKFKPLADITVTSIRYGVVSANANLDVGIYADSAGAPGSRLVSSGSFAMSGALSAKTISSTTLTAGTPYWLAIASDSTVATFIVHQIIASQSAMNATVVMQPSALPLPATASTGTAASSVVPMLYILT